MADPTFNPINAAIDGFVLYQPVELTEGEALYPEAYSPDVQATVEERLASIIFQLNRGARLLRAFKFAQMAPLIGGLNDDINGFRVSRASTQPDTSTAQYGDIWLQPDAENPGARIPRVFNGIGYVEGVYAVDAILMPIKARLQALEAQGIDGFGELVDGLREELRGEATSAANTFEKVEDLIGALTTALTTKAPLANPAFSGIPTVPTAAPGTNSLQAASTEFVNVKADAAAAAAAAASVPLTQKGAANGVASLDGTGKVPSGQLPSYVDDIIDVANFAALPGTGETGKIYITIDNNKQFRWSGSAYVEIVNSPGSTDALAEGSTNKYFTDARAQAAVVSSMSRRGVMVGDYGSGDMSTSAGFTARLIAAITEAAAGGEVIIPYGQRGLTEKVTPLASQLIRGIGGHPKLTKEFNGDMIDCSAAEVQFENIWLAGAGASFTGRGFVMTNATFGKQKFRNVWGYGMAGPVVEFTVADAGNKSTFTDCTFQRQTSTNAAVVLPADTAETTGARDFIACHADGGTLIAFNKSANTRVIGGDCTTLDFSGSAGISLRAAIEGMRIANGGSTMSILGNDVSMKGCIHGGSIELGASSSRNWIEPGVLATGAIITDLSTATGEDVNRISNYGLTGNPVWLADTTNPVFGSAGKNSRVSFLGRFVLFTGEIVMAADTTYGSGPWFVRPPAPWSGLKALTRTTGSAKIWQNGVGYKEVTCRMAAGGDKLYFSPAGSGNDASATVPHTAGANDRLEWSILFERG